jgi:hypothetical protein
MKIKLVKWELSLFGESYLVFPLFGLVSAFLFRPSFLLFFNLLDFLVIWVGAEVEDD